MLLARIQLEAAVAAGDDSARGRILTRAVESWQSSAPEELARFLESCGQWVALAEGAFPTETAPSEFLLRSRIHALARLGRAEAAARGGRLSQELVDRVAAAALLDARPRDSWRASRQLRVQLARELTGRALRAAAQDAGGVFDV